MAVAMIYTEICSAVPNLRLKVTEGTPFTFIHCPSDITENGLQMYKYEGRPVTRPVTVPRYRVTALNNNG